MPGTEPPAGCSARKATLDDAEAIAELQNSVHIDQTGVPYATVEEVSRSLTGPETDLDNDLRVVERDGQLVGITMAYTRAPFERISLDGFVRPTEHGRGIGTFLLAWAEARAGVLATLHPSRSLSEPPLLQHWTAEGAELTFDFLASHGYVTERWYHHMEMDLADPVPSIPVPDGLRIRTIEPGEEWAVGEASNEAFKDHFAHVDTDEANWMHHMVGRSDFDRSLWFIAVAEDGTIAGDCLCFVHEDRGTPCGLIDDLAVRRPWRRKGLGAALLATGLREIQSRGIPQAELFVDSQNPTGAMGVYERAGLKVSRSFASLVKPLPGTPRDPL